MSRELPEISIIIPHLNQPGHLRRCLASLAAQTFDMERVEILVIDNGSKQLPTEICTEFSGVRLDREKTPGPGPARNKGVGLSGGGILAFVDADCIADPEWLAAIAAALNEDASSGIIGGDVRIAVVDPKRLTMLEAYESIYAYRQQNYIERQGFSGTGNLAMRRSAYETVGAFAGIDVAEDREWGQRATAAGYRIGYVPGMIVFHPARETFADLCVKWDRHVDHDFEEQVHGIAGRLRWVAKALALLISPGFELIRIYRSDRVRTARERRLAAFVLLRIRIYRALRMAAKLGKANRSAGSGSWNRTN